MARPSRNHDLRYFLGMRGYKFHHGGGVIDGPDPIPDVTGRIDLILHGAPVDDGCIGKYRFVDGRVDILKISPVGVMAEYKKLWIGAEPDLGLVAGEEAALPIRCSRCQGCIDQAPFSVDLNAVPGVLRPFVEIAYMPRI